MSTDEQDPTAVPGGIHDTGDLDRIWDALEQLADRVDEAASGDRRAGRGEASTDDAVEAPGDTAGEEPTGETGERSEPPPT